MTSRDHALQLREELGHWPTSRDLAKAAGITQSSAWESLNRLKRSEPTLLPAPLPVEPAAASLLDKRELLTSQRGTDGLYHAHYPTGTTTLCGQPVQPVDHFTPIEAWSPTCPACKTTAAAWDLIDQSAPAHWPIETDAA